MRLIILTLLGVCGYAACPTSVDSKGSSWMNTCFVSLKGSDGSGTGAWNAPFLTIGKAFTTMGVGTGDSIAIRGGRYFGDANTIYQPATAKCTLEKPCTVRSYPGEAVIIDGSTMSYRAWFMDKFGSLADSPPYSTDPHDGHWRISGLRFENLQSGAIWNQGISDDIVLKSIRIHGTAGFAFSTCGSCRIFGTHVEVDGDSLLKGIEGAPFQCSGLLPTYYQSPWSSGTTNYQTTYWQIVNEPPLVVQNTYPAGCNDLIVQDSAFIKRHSTGADTFGFETANGVTLERFHASSPYHQGDDTLWNLWGGSGGTDGIDIKGRNILIKDSESLGGKGSLKVWGSAKVENMLVIGGDDTGEGALSGMQRYYQSASGLEFPNSVEYRTIRAIFNDPYTSDAIVVMSKIVGGMGAIEGTEIIVESVPGCTGINGHKLVKHIYHGNGYPVMFSVKNTDGTPFSCPDAYNLSSHIFKIQPSESTWFTPVTFAAGSTDINVTGLTSTYFVFQMDRIRFQSTGALPAGLTAGTDYWVTYRSGAVVRLSATRGGTPIIFSNVGTGTHSAQIVDERTSYAGTVRIAPYSQLFQNMTILSPHRYATSLCAGCDDRVGTSVGYSFQKNTVASPALGVVRRAYFSVAKPRAMFSNGVAAVTLEYFDAEALAVGHAVYFESTCQLPAPLAPKTPYYVVDSDPGAGTIQISATPGGTAIANYVNNGGCVWVRNFLIAPGFASPVVSVSGNVFSAGDRLTAGGYGSSPYPLMNGGSYYVATAETATVGGATFSHLTLKKSASDPTVLTFASPTQRLDNWLRVVDASSTTFRNQSISAYTTDEGSDYNLFYSADSMRAFCALNKAHGGWETGGSCATTLSALLAQEPHSSLEDPALNYSTGRATAASPAAIWNKGHLAGTDSVMAGSNSAVLHWRAPAAAEACAVGLYADSGFVAAVESQQAAGGPRYRQLILGAGGALQADTSYWYRIQCGYEVMTGSFRTLGAADGLAQVEVRLPAMSGAAQAGLETSTDGANWVSGPVVECSAGCELASGSLARRNGVWYRWRRLNASGSTLTRNEKTATVTP